MSRERSSSMQRDGSGLFDGFQIFGKTDSSFSSLTKEDTRPGNHGNHGETRMTHSMYNFQNNNNPPVAVDPEQLPLSPPQSLPARIHGNHGNHDQRNRQRKSSSSHPSSQSVTVSQRKTSSQEKPPSLFYSDHDNTPRNHGNHGNHGNHDHNGLSPLQKVQFTRHSPPPITSPESTSPVPEKLDFFTKSLQDSEELETALSALVNSHTHSTEQLKTEIVEREAQLQSILHSAVQRLRDKLEQEGKVAMVTRQIELALAANDFEKAETLKAETESDAVVIIPFSLPRSSTQCVELVEELNRARKRHIDALKSHCVQVKEFSARFENSSKKIDSQCVNRTEKGNQEFVSLETGLQYRKQHLSIDQEYHDKQVLQLEAERQTLQEEYVFQYKDQEEQLTEVRSEIQILEEKLALLRCKEQTILTEQSRLDTDKMNNDANIKRQLTRLDTEREELEMKSSTLDRDYKVLDEKRKHFTQSKSKLDQITNKLAAVKDRVEKCKSCICEAISTEESSIVNDVQASVSVDLSETLVIPEELEAVLKQIGEKERVLEEISQAKFNAQKVISGLKSQQARLEADIADYKMLKEAAVKVRSYGEAGELSKRQSELEAQLSESSLNIENESSNVTTISEQLEAISSELQQLRLTAEEKQRVFDTESFEVIKAKLVTTADTLRGLSDQPITGQHAGHMTITRQLVRADVRYMCQYLQLIHSRYPTLVLECEAIIKEFGGGGSEGLGESEGLSDKVEKLKQSISEAVQSENYDLADKLNKELIALEMQTGIN